MSDNPYFAAGLARATSEGYAKIVGEAMARATMAAARPGEPPEATAARAVPPRDSPQGRLLLEVTCAS